MTDSSINRCRLSKGSGMDGISPLLTLRQTVERETPSAAAACVTFSFRFMGRMITAKFQSVNDSIFMWQ